MLCICVCDLHRIHTRDTLERLETEAGACGDMVDDLHGRIGRHIAQHRSN